MLTVLMEEQELLLAQALFMFATEVTVLVVEVAGPLGMALVK